LVEVFDGDLAIAEAVEQMIAQRRGRLVRPRGWKSAAGVTRDFEELLDAFLRRDARFAIVGALPGV
jgi:hypothetical protein